MANIYPATREHLTGPSVNERETAAMCGLRVRRCQSNSAGVLTQNRHSVSLFF